MEKKYKILVTAGPVWVPLDSVRVVTNIFGGSLGYQVAQTASRLGHRVTLFLGPGRVCNHDLNKLNARIIRFHYYNDLYKNLIKNIKKHKYDFIYHAAAISDYQPENINKGKIKSGKKNLIVRFVPTKKIIDEIRKIQPKATLVMFKLEVNKSEKQLIEIAFRSMTRSNADYVVANDFNTVIKNHIAFLINRKKDIKKIVGKSNIAKEIVHSIVT